MPTYLDNSFFANVKKEIEKYSKNYEMLNERTKRIEEKENQIQESYEANYSVLDTFGVIR